MGMAAAAKHDTARARDDVPRSLKPIEVHNPRYARAVPGESVCTLFRPVKPTKGSPTKP